MKRAIAEVEPEPEHEARNVARLRRWLARAGHATRQCCACARVEREERALAWTQCVECRGALCVRCAARAAECWSEEEGEGEATVLCCSACVDDWHDEGNKKGV